MCAKPVCWKLGLSSLSLDFSWRAEDICEIPCWQDPPLLHFHWWPLGIMSSKRSFFVELTLWVVPHILQIWLSSSLRSSLHTQTCILHLFIMLFKWDMETFIGYPLLWVILNNSATHISSSDLKNCVCYLSISIHVSIEFFDSVHTK